MPTLQPSHSGAAAEQHPSGHGQQRAADSAVGGFIQEPTRLVAAAAYGLCVRTSWCVRVLVWVLRVCVLVGVYHRLGFGGLQDCAVRLLRRIICSCCGVWLPVGVIDLVAHATQGTRATKSCSR